MDEKHLTTIALGALEALCRIPNTPYFEQPGSRWAREFCERASLKAEIDRFGNILITRPGTDKGAPAMAFVAHLDHPGFEALGADGDNIVGELRGLLSEAALAQGTKVQVVTQDGRRVPGEIIGRLSTGEKRTLLFEVDRAAVGALPCGVILDLVDFKLEGDTITARALDDLAGCAATLAAMRWASEHPSAGTVYGVLTRAEEVGLEGARLAAEAGLLARNTVIVSVESSRTLPGAEIGGGPVIRVGDRLTTFDRAAESYLRAAAERIQARDREFKVQRQLMSGGVCEASAFAAFGYWVTGMAFPLGNYHNAGPNGTVAAEFINTQDFASGVRLLAETVALAGTEPKPAVIERFAKRPAGEWRLSGSS